MNANRLTMVLVAGAILLTVAMIGPGRAANQTTTGPNTVAVVDVQQAFNDLDEKIAIEADQQQTLDEIQSKRKLRTDEIEQLKGPLSCALEPSKSMLAWPSAKPELPSAFCTRTVWLTSTTQWAAMKVRGTYSSLAQVVIRPIVMVGCSK